MSRDIISNILSGRCLRWWSNMLFNPFQILDRLQQWLLFIGSVTISVSTLSKWQVRAQPHQCSHGQNFLGFPKKVNLFFSISFLPWFGKQYYFMFLVAIKIKYSTRTHHFYKEYIYNIHHRSSILSHHLLLMDTCNHMVVVQSNMVVAQSNYCINCQMPTCCHIVFIICISQ